MTTTEIRRRAPTLDDLLRLLRGACGHGEACDCRRPLLTERDWTRLPTYGGPEPRSTSGVWSWDAARVLVGTCATDVRLEDRPTCGATWDATEVREGHRVNVVRSCDRASDCVGGGDGLCATHYQQQRRTGSTRPIRVPAAGRINVRLSEGALQALGSRPALHAREIIESWAKRGE